MLSIKDYLYLTVLIAVGALLVWWHHQAVLEGEAKVEASYTAALVKQHADDARLTQDTINALRQDNARLRALSAAPAPRVRLCIPTHYASSVPAPSSPAGPRPPVVADGGTTGGVLLGADQGSDAGGAVRDIALAGAAIAIYRRHLVEWAERESGK